MFRENLSRKIRKIEKKSVGKYSFVNTTTKSWKQLPAGLLFSCPSKVNTFRKSVKKVVKSTGIKMGIKCK
jgi:hypothetical protein